VQRRAHPKPQGPLRRAKPCPHAFGVSRVLFSRRCDPTAPAAERLVCWPIPRTAGGATRPAGSHDQVASMSTESDRLTRSSPRRCSRGETHYRCRSAAPHAPAPRHPLHATLGTNIYIYHIPYIYITYICIYICIYMYIHIHIYIIYTYIFTDF